MTPAPSEPAPSEPAPPVGAEAPDISVIVPHLDQPEALARLLDSLEAQEAHGVRVEVIVADNGSRAPLPATILGRPGLRVVSQPEPGPGPARNAGAAVARGGVLAFTDSDGIADPGWIAAIARHFARPDAAPVIGGAVGIALRGPRPDAIEAFEMVYGYRQSLYIRRDRYAATLNLAMRAEVFGRVGGFCGLDMAEDRDWGQRAHALGIPMAYLPDALILTPARMSLAELARKWDRVVAHDFAQVRGAGAWLRWGLRALAVAASPLPEALRIARSDRLSGRDQRLAAFGVLWRIRLHRARRMLQLAFGADRRALAEGWRKGGGSLP